MDFTAKGLAAEIQAEVRDSSPMATATTAGLDISDFCGIWGKAKPILELVSGIVVLIPGLGSVAGGVLKGLIKIGDQISAEVCE